MRGGNYHVHDQRAFNSTQHLRNDVMPPNSTNSSAAANNTGPSINKQSSYLSGQTQVVASKNLNLAGMKAHQR